MLYNQTGELSFLKETVNKIKVALFKCEINEELQMPNNIIQTLRVEDDGTIWFFTTCKGNHARFVNKWFYARLDYYKKDTGCRLQITGKACIEDNEVDNPFSAGDYYSKEGYNTVLVKMKIMQAEIFENKTIINISWAEKIKSAFNHLFVAPAHKVYNFS